MHGHILTTESKHLPGYGTKGAFVLTHQLDKYINLGWSLHQLFKYNQASGLRRNGSLSPSLFIQW